MPERDPLRFPAGTEVLRRMSLRSQRDDAGTGKGVVPRAMMPPRES
jgi:hypothetical protein